MLLRRAAALVVLALVAAACSAGPGTGGQLEGTDWVLSSYDQDGTLTILPAELFADARFSANRVSGSSGCNDYDALYRAGARTLIISQMRSTFIACSEATNAFEATFQALLGQSRFYSTRGGVLTIYGSNGPDPLLVFDAAPRNPLLGSWVVDSYTTPSGTQVATLPDTELTAVFGLAKVGGSSGCNTYDGVYGTNGRTVAIGRLATTSLVCPDAIMTQETDFLAALQGAAFIDWRGTSLTLTDRNASVLVALTRPQPEPTASPEATATATPSPTATSTPSATPSPSPKATAAPTPTPTAKPTATPSPKPTPTATYAPTATPTAAPTLEPPASLPPVAECAIPGPSGTVLATITYPRAWFTVAEPPEIACRYFDPAEIVIPADPATVTAAVSIVGAGASYADAVTAATDPVAWDVLDQAAVTVSGLPATFVEATSTSDAAGVPVGTTRYAYIIDYSVLTAVVIQTQGVVDDATYDTNTSVVDLIAAESTIIPAS
jgi:heat shock protein HslJ